MNVKDTVLTLFSNNFDDTFKADRLPYLITSTAPKMRELCGNDLYKEYKALPADYGVTDVSEYSDGIIALTIGSHSFIAGDFVYFTGANLSYTGACLIDSVTSTTINVYYSFDGITKPETFPTDMPDFDGVYITSDKKHDLVTAESYLVLYSMTMLLEEVQDNVPFATSTDFGEGQITNAGFDALDPKRKNFLAEARELIGKYYVEDDNSSFNMSYGSLSGDDPWQTS